MASLKRSPGDRQRSRAAVALAVAVAIRCRGANQAVPTDSMKGPLKAAPEASCRCLACGPGGRGIRLHAIAPGPLKARAASGPKDFGLRLAEAEPRAPIGEPADIMDVVFTFAFRAMPYARRLSGETILRGRWREYHGAGSSARAVRAEQARTGTTSRVKNVDGLLPIDPARPSAQAPRRACAAPRVRAAWTAAVAACALAFPPGARASFLPHEMMDKAAMGLAWFIVVAVPIGGIVLFWMVHVLPEKIAHRRHHPQTDAIQTLCLLSLVFGGLLWPLAWLWAYTKPTFYRAAYGTEKHDDYYLHEGEKALAGRLDAFELEHLRDELDGMAERGPLSPQLKKLRRELETAQPAPATVDEAKAGSA